MKSLLPEKRYNIFAKIFFAGILVCGILSACSLDKSRAGPPDPPDYPVELILSKSRLTDKIKGGWAGQVIGCTYGGPTEFKFRGTMIQDYTPIEWDETKMEWNYENRAGLYDDVYMDLTFVEVIDREGIDAPASSHAKAFAYAEYNLWHANRNARACILQGIMPPASGYWENNAHADDIDFQIEADFAGLMSPGMVNPASEICDRVGHIMNYGDGWYGGVYVAAMYSLSFYTGNIELIVSEALRSIPEESDFHACISDVIQWYYMFPEDWKRTWFETEKKWSSDVGCPNGVFTAYNIDAKINAAYIVIGLLYGEGDFGKTVDISTRCGQDSDCNPASAGGILGTVLGYEGIPDYWKQGIDRVEDRDFKYTTMSLNDAYEMSNRHALEMIRRNGGEVEKDQLRIRVEEPMAVQYEKSFEGHFPVSKIQFRNGMRFEVGGQTEYSFDFEGIGFVISGDCRRTGEAAGNVELLVDVFIDGELYKTAILPTERRAQRDEIIMVFKLSEGSHQVRLAWKNPSPGYDITMEQILIYGPS